LGLQSIKQFKSKRNFRNGHGLFGETYTLEINFNIQLGGAYNGLGDFKKKISISKANQLLKE
jgi:hypothetical protein